VANILQATEWLKQHKRVRRAAMGLGGYFSLTPAGFVVFTEEKFTAALHITDLVAEDWEVDE